MARYRVMYRPLFRYKDIILTVEADGTEEMLLALKARRVPDDVQYIYVHEYTDDGINEVVAYEADEEKHAQPTLLSKLKNQESKPRIKVKKRKLKQPPLAAASIVITQGHYHAYELSCLT